MGLKHAEHFTDEEKQRRLAGYPAHEPGPAKMAIHCSAPALFLRKSSRATFQRS
jgi:hypothetical protein